MTADIRSQLSAVLRSEYFASQTFSSDITAESYLASPEGASDLNDHLTIRTDTFRSDIIPWLDSMKSLRSSRVLEIGSGTGCSTLALAEQGAAVTGIDIDEPSLRVARRRAELFSVGYTLHRENAVHLDRFKDQPFDFVIFFASLEHMTINERIESLKKAWTLLSDGGLLVVIETPNRLWFRDDHTALLPYFHWLPDQLAFYYTPMSPRKNFYGFAPAAGETVPEIFHRLGRGVSFHEFEIALGGDAISHVAGDLQAFLKKRRINPLNMLGAHFSKEHRYHALLRKITPRVHAAYLHENLYLAIKKNRDTRPV